MVQSKSGFFSKGVENQIRPDIVIDLKRKDIKQIKKWNDYQRHEALKWLEEQEVRFNEFIDAIRSA